jgi:hypothetical protein
MAVRKHFGFFRFSDISEVISLRRLLTLTAVRKHFGFSHIGFTEFAENRWARP